MQLLIENEIFYRNFKETLAELETNSKYQPRKRQVPCYQDLGIILVEIVIVVLVAYAFALLAVLCMMNYVLLAVFVICVKKLIGFLEKIRAKLGNKYKTKDFKKFMQKENDVVYSKLDIPIKLEWEKEGRWLELILEGKDDTYEQLIATRRELIFR